MQGLSGGLHFFPGAAGAISGRFEFLPAFPGSNATRSGAVFATIAQRLRRSGLRLVIKLIYITDMLPKYRRGHWRAVDLFGRERITFPQILRTFGRQILKEVNTQ